MNDLVRAFNAAGVRYLLVGGQAMRLAGMPRFSMDWDFFIPPREADNLAKLNDLLPRLYHRIWIPAEVHRELTAPPVSAIFPS